VDNSEHLTDGGDFLLHVSASLSEAAEAYRRGGQAPAA
jgi:hypothetical protein